MPERDPQTNCKRCGLIVHTALGGRGNPLGRGWICDTCFEAAVARGEIKPAPLHDRRGEGSQR